MKMKSSAVELDADEPPNPCCRATPAGMPTTGIIGKTVRNQSTLPRECQRDEVVVHVAECPPRVLENVGHMLPRRGRDGPGDLLPRGSMVSEVTSLTRDGFATVGSYRAGLSAAELGEGDS